MHSTQLDVNKKSKTQHSFKRENQKRHIHLFFSSLIYGQALFLSQSALAANNFEYESGVNLIHQHTNDSNIDNNTSLSVDFILVKHTLNGQWTMHLEGSNTPNQKGVSNVIQDSNADSGSSLTHSNQGRLQLSELNYHHHYPSNISWSLGLVDATSFLDTSEIMNDENNQFISASMVNNPIIDFPDYVLGGSINAALSETFSVQLFISSTHGIADNNSRNYSSLFEMNEDEKGLFTALELQYKNQNSFIHSGFWRHNGKHDALDGSDKDDLSNYGGYMTAGWRLGRHQYESRFGLANDEVSSATHFFSLAYQYQMQQTQLGIGYSATQFSNQLIKRPNNTETVEAHLKIALHQNWHITPSLQWFNHPIYDSIEITAPSTVMSANMRVSYHF